MKVACWNVEWTGELWPDIVPSKYHVDSRNHIAEKILSIDADVMSLEEGLKNPSDMQSYVDTFFHTYSLVLRADGESWGVQGIKNGSVNSASLMSIAELYEKTARTCPIHYWGQLTESSHDLYRLPQVLRFTWKGQDFALDC